MDAVVMILIIWWSLSLTWHCRSTSYLYIMLFYQITLSYLILFYILSPTWLLCSDSIYLGLSFSHMVLLMVCLYLSQLFLFCFFCLYLLLFPHVDFRLFLSYWESYYLYYYHHHFDALNQLFLLLSYFLLLFLYPFFITFILVCPILLSYYFL